MLSLCCMLCLLQHYLKPMMWQIVYLVTYWPLVSRNLFLQNLNTEILNSMFAAVKKSPLFWETATNFTANYWYIYNTYGEPASNE